MSVDACRLIDLPRIRDARGDLSFAEGGRHMPFEIRRIYYLYNVPSGAERGAHGHRALEQLIIPLAGAFEVEIDDGIARRRVRLDNPARALYVCPMMWRDLRHFTEGAVALVLASLTYDEADYFRDYQDFLRAVANR